MILETVLWVSCALLLIALMGLSLILVSGIDFDRIRRRVRAWWVGLPNDDKTFLRWMGRVVWVWVLLMAAR